MLELRRGVIIIYKFGKMDGLIAETRGSKILLVAKEPVAYMSFNDKNEPVTWKDCKIRKWLNGEFLNRFTEAEKKRINKTEVVTYPTGLYGDVSEIYTHDYVFLLEEDEAEEYFACDVDRLALDDNRKFIEGGLRPFGKTGDVTCYVDKNGRVCSGGRVSNNQGGSVSYNSTADRTKKFAIIPAMGIDKKSGKDIATCKGNIFGREEVKKDIINFGGCEREDHSTTSLEGQILEKQKDKMLVITKEAIAELPFNKKLKSVNGNTSDIRKLLDNQLSNYISRNWLIMFAEGEKSRILETEIKMKKTPYSDVNQGKNTKDKLFLLSIDEVKKYFPDEVDRICKPMPKIAKEYKDNKFGPGSVRGWLRDMGKISEAATSVGQLGEINVYGAFDEKLFHPDLVTDKMGIRPAMWIKVK